MSKMLLGLVVVMAGGCGPGLTRPDPREIAKVSLADSAGDAASVRKLLHESVTLGRLHFDDAACAAAFPPGEIGPDRFDTLAGCLAGLKLRANGREDGLGDVAVLSYGPGFEVEARLLHHHGRSQLTWIGFASLHQGSPPVPTLDTAAFEALRTGGQRVPVLDEATARAIEGELVAADGVEAATAWLKVCLDEKGTIFRVEPYEPSSYVALDAFTAAVKTWTFRPFEHGGKARPVCSMIRMVHPAEKAPPVETLPLPPPPSGHKRPPLSLAQMKFARLLEGKRIAGDKMIVPDGDTKWEISRLRGQKVTGSFRVCLDTAGRVESVLPLQSTGFPAYDRDLLAGMNKWVYSPYSINDEPVPVCTMITFIYSQR